MMVLSRRKILAGLGIGGVAIASAMSLGPARWRRETARLVDRLLRNGMADGPGRVHFSDLAGLPAPVAMYFRAVLKDGQPMIRSARVAQQGEFHIDAADGARKPAWKPFTATEYFSASPCGFVWDAAIGAGMLDRVLVRDAYVGGRGSLEARLFSLLPVAEARNAAELDAGALQRYLAEAPWFPTRLLPSAGVRWSAIDGRRALATLADAEITVSLQFEFAANGDITRVSTPSRYRQAGRRYESTPWEGVFDDYRETAGMRIPVVAEAAWRHGGSRASYFRGNVTNIDYEFFA